MAKRPAFKTGKTAGVKTTDRPAFIEAADLPTNGRTAEFKIGKYIGLYQREEGATSLFVEVTNAAGTYTWSVRCAGPDRISLQELCGRNLIDWPGKRIKLYAAEGSRGGSFVNLFNPNRERR